MIEVLLVVLEIIVVYNGIIESYMVMMKNCFYIGFVEIVFGVDYYNDSVLFWFEGDLDLEENVENVGVFI